MFALKTYELITEAATQLIFPNTRKYICQYLQSNYKEKTTITYQQLYSFHTFYNDDKNPLQQ